jgi:hypothetical protein
MSLPLVVEYLRTHSIADLFTEHGVRLSPSPARPYKASLNYDQIAARNDDALAAECRGLVLSTADGTPITSAGIVGDLVVLARPMDRFFNLGQGCAHVVDDALLAHPGTRVFEKLDGTLCIVYFDTIAGEWCVATRSVPDADRTVDGFADHTFRSLFEVAVNDGLGMSWAHFTSLLGRPYTYCFELTSPRAGSGVVNYGDEHRLHLLAVRDIGSGFEVCPSAFNMSIPVAASHVLSTVEAMRLMVEGRQPREAEGVVVRGFGRLDNGSFPRVKVKSSAYVAAHGLSSDVGASPRNLLRVILSGQWDDVGQLCRKHLREHGDALVVSLAAWSQVTNTAFANLNAQTGGDRKAFAIAVQMAGLPIAPMMAMWTKQATDARAWVDARKVNGGWSDAFLDSLATMLTPSVA